MAIASDEDMVPDGTGFTRALSAQVADLTFPCSLRRSPSIDSVGRSSQITPFHSRWVGETSACERGLSSGVDIARTVSSCLSRGTGTRTVVGGRRRARGVSECDLEPGDAKGANVPRRTTGALPSGQCVPAIHPCTLCGVLVSVDLPGAIG